MTPTSPATGGGLQDDLFGRSDWADLWSLLADEFPHTLELLYAPAAFRATTRHLIRTSADCPYASCGGWAYAPRPNGFWFGRLGEFHRRPDRSVDWAAIDAALDRSDVPALRDSAAWMYTLSQPWLELVRPHEMWPDPHLWHPQYADDDHADPNWTRRAAAWTETIRICRAISNQDRT